ncbi:uncharacterized protein V1478_008271 [Vespula squamosa]|uniref:Uncharacterized protein n=1 Tax=Vespula squamosa TaxID=30214 RepID=A0ABD2AYB1_VESSQ
MQKNSLQEIADVHIKIIHGTTSICIFLEAESPEKDKSTSQRHLLNPTNCNKRQENGPMFFKGMLHPLMREYLKLEFSGVGYRSFHRFYKKLVSSLICLYAELEWMWRTVDTIWAFTASSMMIFFLEITWAITLFVQICVRNEESLCSYCWSRVLAITKGWRRALFYLPLSCILAWKPHKLGLSYVAAGLLAILSLLHIASSALGRRISCQSSSGTDSVGESLLNARPENYDRFEEVLVPEVLDDGVSGPTVRVGDSDGEI